MFNPLMGALKPQSSGPLYSNTVIGTLAVDGWAVTFGTARRPPGASIPLTPWSKFPRPPSPPFPLPSLPLPLTRNFEDESQTVLTATNKQTIKQTTQQQQQ